jgi:hypothetical protein
MDNPRSYHFSLIVMLSTTSSAFSSFRMSIPSLTVPKLASGIPVSATWVNQTRNWLPLALASPVA